IGKDLEKCFICGLVVHEKVLCIRDRNDVSRAVKPIEVIDALLECVPIATEIVGKLQGSRKFIEQRGRCAASVAPNALEDETRQRALYADSTRFRNTAGRAS